VLLLLGAVLYYLRASTGFPAVSESPNPPSAASPTPADPTASDLTPAAGGDSGSPSVEPGTIVIHGTRVTKAMPFETVSFRGTYYGGPEAFVRAELREGATWKPLSYLAKTDQLGRFITHVDLSEPGPHWLRVVDPEADVASEPFVLYIEE
jgi:hypothetical protein